MIKAVKWKVKVEGDKRSIELFDEHGETITGDASWEDDFYCSSNNLTSLEGAPKEVGMNFYCHNNNLTSLEGAPKEVGRIFYCDHNNLTSLDGAPKEVGGSFSCYDNNLTSLEGAPKEVGGDFYCHNNNLTSLEGAPKEVGGFFDCSNNNLTSLEGTPKIVDDKQVIMNRIFLSKLERGYVYADGILSKLISRKRLNDGIEVFKTKAIGRNEIIFVVKRGDFFSHGETIEAAIEDLKYKTIERDSSKFEYLKNNLDHELTLDEAISLYRTVTGACSSGVKNFVKNNKIPERITPDVILKITEGAYGNKLLMEYLNDIK